MIDRSAIRKRFAAVGRNLNERGRRLFAAAEARTAGYGGIAAAARATEIAPSTIGRGLKDLDDPDALSGVVRRPGSGRRALTETDADDRIENRVSTWLSHEALVGVTMGGLDAQS